MSELESQTSSAMLAEVIPPKVLPRVLTRFDLITLYFALIFGSYGAGQMAAGGWAAIPMMILAAVTFLVPCALAAYELGTLFPGEGGIYIWAHKTAGPIHGFIAGWVSWLPIFFLLPLGAVTVVAHLQFALGVEWSLAGQVFAQCGFVGFVTLISIMRLRLSQNYISIIFFVSIGTAIAVFASGVMTEPAANPVDAEIFSLDLSVHGALYSAAVLWLLGVEVPFNMGAEIKARKKAIGQMFIWGTLALLIGYLIGIAGILWTTPQDEINVTTAVAAGVGRQWAMGGVIVAFAIVFAISSQDVAYMNTYSRLLFISGIEKRLPAVFGQITSASRTPVAAYLAQGAGAILVILTFANQPNLAVAFNFYIAAVIVVWCASLFYLYYGILRARFSLEEHYTERGQDVWRIPGGKTGVVLVAVWGAIFNSVAIYYVFAIPLTDAVDASQWRLWLAGLAVIVAVIGAVIFWSSQSAARRASIEDELAKYAVLDPE
jgi:glutamate:GABA antiporter